MSGGKRERSVERWASIVASAAIVFVVGWMTLEAKGPRPAATGAAKSDVDASVAAPSSASPASADAGPAADAGASTLALPFPTMPEGDAAVMPSGAPRHVKIGVVLVAFQGAEGAPASARSKREALAIAERLGQEARADFHAAVNHGDPGSADDIGRIPRGVLDPRTEVAVFALATGEVSDVLETPRGYWIVRRID